MFALIEYVTAPLERHGRAAPPREPARGVFAGRSMMVIDEAWHLVERRATGEYANDLARRARHLGLFLIAISQQLSDFAGHGRALLRNSTQQLLLRQSPDELAFIKDAAGSPTPRRDVARLKTVKGATPRLLDQRHPRPRHGRPPRRPDRIRPSPPTRSTTSPAAPAPSLLARRRLEGARPTHPPRVGAHG